MAVGGSSRANLRKPTGLALAQQRSPRTGTIAEANAAISCEFPPIEPFRTASLACRPSCSLAYFQPRRVRPGQFPGVPFEVSK
jgi:hypothetical protein